MTYSIQINKTNENLQIDFDSFPEHVKNHIIEYGLKQKLNDCHSDVTEVKFPDAVVRVHEVTKRVKGLLEGWTSGEIGKQRASGGKLERMIEQVLLETLSKSSQVKTKKNAQYLMEKHGRDKMLGAMAKSTGKTSEEFLDGITQIALERLNPAPIKGLDLDLTGIIDEN